LPRRYIKTGKNVTLSRNLNVDIRVHDACGAILFDDCTRESKKKKNRTHVINLKSHAGLRFIRSSHVS